MVGASTKGIPLIRRAEMLARLMKDRIGITVTGAHGKTTTTSLISLILKEANFQPTVVIGGLVQNFGGGACLGDGPYFCVEADESDGSFLLFSPTYSVVMNIDREHLDFYQNIERIKRAFLKFIRRTKREGCLFYCGDNPYLKEILTDYQGDVISFGLSRDCDVSPENINLDGFYSHFDCIYKGNNLGQLKVRLSGYHNISNALAAVAVALRLGIDFKVIKESLSSYQGIKRRFQIKGNLKDYLIIDDYAHHPTEVQATLAALKEWGRRTIGVFQPHRYSRTKYLLNEFGGCFKNCDHLIVTDIYSANEKQIRGVNAKDIYEKVRENNHKSVCYLKKDKILDHLLGIIKPKDIVVVMGAGDIGKIADELALRLKEGS
jgi:UDP-N-acetylmuramate--alanine ligase